MGLLRLSQPLCFLGCLLLGALLGPLCLQHQLLQPRHLFVGLGEHNLGLVGGPACCLQLLEAFRHDLLAPFDVLSSALGNSAHVGRGGDLGSRACRHSGLPQHLQKERRLAGGVALAGVPSEVRHGDGHHPLQLLQKPHLHAALPVQAMNRCALGRARRRRERGHKLHVVRGPVHFDAEPRPCGGSDQDVHNKAAQVDLIALPVAAREERRKHLLGQAAAHLLVQSR
mmetsp:Transcript_9598/g.24744  ORF Transcript_9598/g.24744 Transcript_9598/m.24744 type:complete len:227 (-) Transcript_9598:298-978(-)